MVPPCSHRVSRVRRYSGYSWLPSLFAYETITLYGVPSHALLLRYRNAVYCPYPEDIATFGLASSVFARHYLRNLGWFLFLVLLRCFSSDGSRRIPIYSVYVAWLLTMRVSPFGYLRVAGCLHLTAAFRSLPRPSSAPIAKASALCSLFLNLLFEILLKSSSFFVKRHWSSLLKL